MWRQLICLPRSRPSNYDITTAIMLGPITPDPTMDTSTLDICRTLVEDSPSKLFIGELAGAPCHSALTVLFFCFFRFLFRFFLYYLLPHDSRLRSPVARRHRVSHAVFDVLDATAGIS